MLFSNIASHYIDFEKGRGKHLKVLCSWNKLSQKTSEVVIEDFEAFEHLVYLKLRERVKFKIFPGS